MTEREKDQLLLAAAAAGALLGARAIVRKRNEYDFRDKTALVTGGSRGLGLLLARELAREGSRVAICARDRRSSSAPPPTSVVSAAPSTPKSVTCACGRMWTR